MRTSMIDIATLAGIHDPTIELCTQVILGCHLFDSIDHHVVVKSPFRLRKIHFDPFSISNDRQHGGRRETQE